MNNEEVWTVKEVAEFLHLSSGRIYTWVSNQTIPFHRVNGSVRFIKSEIIDFVKKGEK